MSTPIDLDAIAARWKRADELDAPGPVIESWRDVPALVAEAKALRERARQAEALAKIHREERDACAAEAGRLTRELDVERAETKRARGERDLMMGRLDALRAEVEEAEAEKCDMLRDLERLRVQRDALRADAAVVIRCDALLGVLIVRAIHRLADSEGPQLRGALLSARIEAPLSRRKDGAT